MYVPEMHYLRFEIIEKRQKPAFGGPIAHTACEHPQFGPKSIQIHLRREILAPFRVLSIRMIHSEDCNLVPVGSEEFLKADGITAVPSPAIIVFIT